MLTKHEAKSCCSTAISSDWCQSGTAASCLSPGFDTEWLSGQRHVRHSTAGQAVLDGAYPGKISAIHTSVQSWHEDLIVWRWDVRWVGNETASRDVMHTLEEAAVVNLQHSTNIRILILSHCIYICIVYITGA